MTPLCFILEITLLINQSILCSYFYFQYSTLLVVFGSELDVVSIFNEVGMFLKYIILNINIAIF